MKKLLLAIALSMAAAHQPARAAEIDFSVVLRNLDGSPFTDCLRYDTTRSPPFCEHTVDMTVGAVAVMVLGPPVEQSSTPSEQVRRGRLAQRVYGAGKLDLDAAEIKMIEDLAYRRSLHPVALTRFLEVLDPAALKDK